MLNFILNDKEWLNSCCSTIFTCMKSIYILAYVFILSLKIKFTLFNATKIDSTEIEFYNSRIKQKAFDRNSNRTDKE